MLCKKPDGLVLVHIAAQFIWGLRNHHRGQGLCGQIKTQPEGSSPRAGLSAHNAQDQGDGSYSNMAPHG